MNPGTLIKFSMLTTLIARAIVIYGDSTGMAVAEDKMSGPYILHMGLRLTRHGTSKFIVYLEPARRVELNLGPLPSVFNVMTSLSGQVYTRDVADIEQYVDMLLERMFTARWKVPTV